MDMLDFMEVFETKNYLWTWDCGVCKVSGDLAPDEENAWEEAEHHYTMHHTDLQPWEVEVPC